MDRVAALSGLAAPIAILAGVSLAEVGANPTQPSPVIAEALALNHKQIRLGAQLTLLGAFLMLWFVSYLYSRLRRAETTMGWPSALVLGGGIVAAALILVEGGFYYAGSELADYGDDTQVAKIILLWGWNSASLLAPAFGAVLFGSAWAGFRHAGLPRWLTWFTGIMFVILVVIGVVLQTPGLGALAGSLWFMVASVTLALNEHGRAVAV